MSLLAIVTFDLHRASPNDYPKVKDALSKLKLKKQIRSRKSTNLNRLPANTFAARFSGKWSKGKATNLCDYLRKNSAKAIKAFGLNATIFVAVGDDWAWGRRSW